MKKPIVTVYTNDKNLWLLNGFQYLFKKYWSSSQLVRIVGYASPKKGTLSENFSFVSINPQNYPVNKWSTGLIQSLDRFLEDGEEFIIFMLEDYWLTESVDHETLQYLMEYIHDQPRNILRIDLTTDRCQYRRFLTHHGEVTNGCQLLRTTASSPYQMSFQAGIWNIKLLREILHPDEDPWMSEIEGSKRLAMAEDKYIVLGTRNHPVKYQPVYRSGRDAINISKLHKEDQDIISKRGWM